MKTTLPACADTTCAAQVRGTHEEQSSRMRQSERKLAQREVLLPLIRELSKRISRGGYSGQTLHEETGLPEYQIQRILSTAIAAPSWPELTALIVAAGMSPNEAARLVGLYDHPEMTDTNVSENPLASLDAYETDLLALLRDPALSEHDREDIVRAFITFVTMEKEARLKRFRPVLPAPSEHPPVSAQRPRRTAVR